VKKSNTKQGIQEIDEELQYKKAILEKASTPALWTDDFITELYNNPYHNIWSYLKENVSDDIYYQLESRYFEDFQSWPKDTVPDEVPENTVSSTAKIKLVSVAEIQKKPAEWLIHGYIPKNNITVLAADGGVGKTSVACEVAAAVSSGRHSIFVPDEVKYNTEPEEPGIVIFLSGEDTFEHTLRAKLEDCNANLQNILTVSLDNEMFSNVKFGSAEMESIVSDYRPKLLIIDPLQSFLPEGMNVASRLDMRSALHYPVAYGSKYGVTTLILAHTNKKQNVSARDRISDSSDLWDIARSVLMSGSIRDSETRYLSHEKSNYGDLQDTILYDFDNGHLKVTGRSDKRDGFYQKLKSSGFTTAAPALSEAESFLIDLLSNGQPMETAYVDARAKDYGISPTALRRAKSSLGKEHKITRFSTGIKSSKKHFMQIVTNQ